MDMTYTPLLPVTVLAVWSDKNQVYKILSDTTFASPRSKVAPYGFCMLSKYRMEEIPVALFYMIYSSGGLRGGLPGTDAARAPQ